MSRTSMVVWLLAVAGCDPCEQDSCYTDGEATVDLSGALPVFELVGLSEDSRPPNELQFFACDSDDRWDLVGLDVLTVTYGETPKGAREVDTDEALVEGEQYAFTFFARDPNPFNAYKWLEPEAWGGTFVHGDPDSFVLGGYCGSSDSLR